MFGIDKWLQPKMSSGELIKDGIVAGVLEVIYIGIVAIFFMIAESVFPSDTSLVMAGIAAFLILVVLSVTISGMLILGYPLYYALQQRYPEALAILLVTCATLIVVFFLLVIAAMLAGIAS